MILLALLTSIGLHASEKQILHLSLRCQNAAPTREAEVISRQLRRHNPGAVIRVVNVQWPCDEPVEAQDAAAAELRTALGRALADTPRFDLLALDLPDGSKEHPTLMMPLGYLEADGPSALMNEALAPLRDRGTRHAKIILTAGHGLSGPDDLAAVHARRLLDFIGAPGGSVFGLQQPKVLFERPSREDFRLSLLMVAVAVGFDQMMWRNLHFTFGRILLSGLYTAGFRTLYSYLAATVYGEKPADVSVAGARFNMMMSSILGTVVAAAQVMKFADINAGMATTMAGTTVAWVPAIYLVNAIRRRWPWISGVLRESINGGRTFTARGEGVFDVRKLGLEEDAREVFGCESALTISAPLAAEPAAA